MAILLISVKQRVSKKLIKILIVDEAEKNN